MSEKNYYPFGLLHKGYNSQVNGTENNHQTYLGQEFQKELDLNWHSYKWRNADPALGRFFGVDPIAEDYPNQTGYQFASNNPVWKIEIEGLEGYTPNGEDLMNGLGYGVSDVDGGGKTGTTEVKEGFVSKAFNAVGSFFGTIRDGISSAVSGGARSVMGIANTYSGGSTTEAMASGDENAVYQSLNNEAAGLYNVVPEVAGEVAATLVEIVAAETFIGPKRVKSKPNYSSLPEPKNVSVGKKFTQTQKARILQANRDANGGVLRSDKSGQVLNNPVQSKKGVKANMKQAEVDHVKARSKGGTNSNNNAQVLSKKENINKSNN